MKRFLFKIARLFGIVALFRRCYRGHVLVLMYHGVLPDEERCAEGDWLQVRASEFRSQMEYLARHYEVCDISRALLGKRSARPLAIVTFDDGYANNCRTALPILRQLELPATIFVATGFADTQRLFWWDRLRHGSPDGKAPRSEEYDRLKSLHAHDIDAEVDAILDANGAGQKPLPTESYRALNRSEIAELLGSGLVELGSHTHQHEILLGLTDNEIRSTLDQSAKCLRQWGSSARWFAAPNGDFREDQIPLIQEAGFEVCVGTQTGLWKAPNERLSIPRIGIGRGLTLDEFALATCGALAWWQALRRHRGARGAKP